MVLAVSAMLACSHPVRPRCRIPGIEKRQPRTWITAKAGGGVGWALPAIMTPTVSHGHTALPYALARPAVRSALVETDPPSNERDLVENVAKRVKLWKETAPYYAGQGYDYKTSESRGTESVLNALVLASRDCPVRSRESQHAHSVRQHVVTAAKDGGR